MVTIDEPSNPGEGPLLGLPELACADEIVAIVAHPDDESFGLGGVLAALVADGMRVHLLCLTAGEASTVGAAADLGTRRRQELQLAAARLGLASSTMADLPDGGLSAISSEVLEAVVAPHLTTADAVVVFEPGGVTGHPDHCAATAAAERLADRLGIPSLEWGLAETVADSLRHQFGAPLRGFEATGNWPVEIVVDRARQRSAIACHRSQDPDNPLLRRRLELEQDRELVRVRSATYVARLAHFRTRVESLLTVSADQGARIEVLRRLISFAAGSTWPSEARVSPRSATPSAPSVLAERPGRWTLQIRDTSGPVRADPGPQPAWGAAATVFGLVSHQADRAERAPTRHLIARGGGFLYGEEGPGLLSPPGRPRWGLLELAVRSSGTTR